MPPEYVSRCRACGDWIMNGYCPNCDFEESNEWEKFLDYIQEEWGPVIEMLDDINWLISEGYTRTGYAWNTRTEEQ